MKRYVLLALLCIGVMTAWAIAGSISEPIQMLSDNEKVNITAGDYCHRCYPCTDGNSWLQCYLPTKSCSGNPSDTCGYDMDVDYDKCSTWFGTLAGGCYEKTEQYCQSGPQCYCFVDTPSGEWYCQGTGPDFYAAKSKFSIGPCPGG